MNAIPVGTKGHVDLLVTSDVAIDYPANWLKDEMFQALEAVVFSAPTLSDDLGSGCLLDTTGFGLAYEPRPQDSLRDGELLRQQPLRH